MDTTYRSRKFILAVAFTIASILGLFIDKISGSEFIAAASVILGLYGAANVGYKFVERTEK